MTTKIWPPGKKRIRTDRTLAKSITVVAMVDVEISYVPYDSHDAGPTLVRLQIPAAKKDLIWSFTNAQHYFGIFIPPSTEWCNTG